MRFRILIQNRDERDKHEACITFETDNISKVTQDVKELLKTEISERNRLLAKYLTNKKKDFLKDLIDDIPDDLIDWNSKGSDISRQEYLENEIWFELHG